jgi:hypothetical protein
LLFLDIEIPPSRFYISVSYLGVAYQAWVAVAVFVPYINTVCGLIPLLFPKLAIYGLQITGKLNLTQPKSGGKGGET